MSSLIVVGMLGIVTMTCCGTAILTKAIHKVQVAFAGAILSAAGLAYMIVYLIRNGLSGLHLAVAICCSIIFSELVFCLLYFAVKEPAPKSEEFGDTSLDLLCIESREQKLIEALHNNYLQEKKIMLLGFECVRQTYEKQITDLQKKIKEKQSGN